MLPFDAKKIAAVVVAKHKPEGQAEFKPAPQGDDGAQLDIEGAIKSASESIISAAKMGDAEKMQRSLRAFIMLVLDEHEASEESDSMS